MADTPAYPLQVYFDGSCSVCTAKISAYRRMEHGSRLEFIDVSAPGFDPTPYGITLQEFMFEMHAIDRENRIYRGVDAFRAIWQAFPSSSGYGLLGTLVTFPGVHLLARVAYWCFARIRKFLPGKADACQNGSCRIGKGGP